MKKGAIFIMLTILLFITAGCDMEKEKAIHTPAYIPVFGFNSPKKNRAIQIDIFSEIEFSILAYTPIFNGLKRNTANYKAGDTFDVILWNAELQVTISRDENVYVYDGTFSDGSGYLRVIVNENTNEISYVQGLAAETVHEEMPVNILVYNCIPEGKIENAQLLSIHSPSIGILVIEAPDGIQASFAGGEVYIANDPSDHPLDITYSTIAGFLGYDIRNIPDADIPVTLSNLNRFVQAVKDRYDETTPWSVDTIDPDGLDDNLTSYYYVAYRRKTNHIGMSRGEITAYSELVDITGEWHELNNSVAGTFTHTAWTIFDGEAYDRENIIESMIAVPYL
jgi:hypothetical protein